MLEQFARGSRTRYLAIIMLVIMAIFVMRLFYLQIIQHDYYVSEANNEQLKQFVLHAKRGEIYALGNDKPVKLVMNEPVFTVYADPKVVQEPEKIAEVVRRVAGGSARDNIRELLDKRSSRYQVLATEVTRKQAEMIRAEKLYGLGFQEGTRRVYPEGQLGAQVLGFVNREGVGQYGVEGALNDRLKGTDGLLRTVTDIREVPLTIGSDNNTIRRPARDGANIVLTIDRNIQAYAEGALAAGLERTGAKTGSVIIMNPQNGAVMAMANLPTYNPAEFNKVTDASLFNNRVISEPYEVGSVAKTFTVATGIDKGVVRPDSTYNNTDSIKVEDRVIKNASKGQTGEITMQHALNWSLNTGMVTIAQRLGNGSEITDTSRRTMYEYYHDRFRLGQKTGIQLTGEAAGTIISPDAVEGNAVRYSNMSFGQGMNLTMIQTAAGFSALINGGNYYSPTVVAGVIEKGNFRRDAVVPVNSGVISASTSAEVREMIHNARSTFYADRDLPGYYVGGKTGTSQTLERGVYIDNQTIGTYLGFGGSDAAHPAYVVMVQVAGPGMNLEGARHALPIFTDISNWLLRYLKLEPKG